jgi:hypothetical protein
MEAIRKIVTVRDNLVQIELPDSFNDKKVELIIFPSEEIPNVSTKEKFDYSQLYGSLNLGMSIDEIDKELKALRSEWERDISIH